MGEAVDRRAAGVHADATGLQRLDRFDLAAQGIPEAKRHRLGMVPRASRPAVRGPALTFRCRARYPTRGLAGPVPSFPRRCGPARPHTVPPDPLDRRPSGPAGVLRLTRPILPAM